MKDLNIFLTITDGFAERMLVKTEFLKKLKSKCNVIIFAPEKGDEYLLRYNPSGLSSFIYWYIRNFMYENPEKNETLWIKLKNIRRTNLLKYLIVRAFIILAKLKFVKKILLHINYLLIPEFYQELFDKYKPSLVILSSGGIKVEDLPLLKTAKKRKILTIGIIQSWDNLTSKGYISPRPDRFIVWNDIMKDELILFHGVDEEDIFVSGPIHYDFYFSSQSEAPSRNLNGGIHPGNKIILVASAPMWTYKHFDWIVDIILKALDDGRIKYTATVVLRLHPNDHPDRYSNIKESKNLIIDYPAVYKEGVGWIQEEEHIQNFIRLLKTSDVVVCVASTISIDAACFDTPIVNIAFDKEGYLPYELSSRRYYDYTHYKNIVRSGGVKIAYSPDELISYISLYLEDRSVDSEGRKKIVQQQCKFTDGRSAERAISYILSFLKQ